MSKTIVALFNEKRSAENAKQDLIRSGLRQNGIDIEDSTNTALKSRLNILRQVGMPERHAEAYCEGMRRGGNLLIAHVDDNDVRQAQEILQKDGAVNVDQRMELWKRDGWTRFDENAKPFSQDEARREMETASRMESSSRADNRDGTFTIPVIEEDINIGKREVETGGVKVREHVTERPVDEQVRLRDEHVKVDRKRVDRPVSDTDRRAMKDQTIEMTEHHEEPVISKQARVKEEVTLSKEQSEHTEHVHDTVKSTDVEIDDIGSNETRNRRR